MINPRDAIQRYPSGSTFRHYKGGMYTLLYIGRHSETEEWFVIYKNAAQDIWLRPYDMFFERVVIQGESVARFTFLTQIEE